MKLASAMPSYLEAGMWLYIKRQLAIICGSLEVNLTVTRLLAKLARKSE